jgi:hypothetical protein
MDTKQTKWEVNAFQVPNVVVDEYASQLSGNAFKLLVLIIRQTKGWHREWDAISASRMANILNMKLTKNVYPYIKELEDFKLIKVSKKLGRISQYSLTQPVPNEGSTQKSTSTSKSTPPVPKKGTTTSTKKGTLQKTVNKETIEKETINDFVVDDASKRTVEKKYPTIVVDDSVLEDLTESFKDAMKNRKAPWTDIQSCFRNYVKGDYIKLTQPTLIVDDRPKLSYAERMREMEKQASQVSIEGEAV